MPTRRAASSHSTDCRTSRACIHAPLTDVVLPTGTFSWYDLPDSVPGSGIDLLFVDGPPMAAGEMARYPAVPILGPRPVTRRGHRHG